jgi:hypothetical protein
MLICVVNSAEKTNTMKVDRGRLPWSSPSRTQKPLPCTSQASFTLLTVSKKVAYRYLYGLICIKLEIRLVASRCRIAGSPVPPSTASPDRHLHRTQPLPAPFDRCSIAQRPSNLSSAEECRAVEPDTPCPCSGPAPASSSSSSSSSIDLRPGTTVGRDLPKGIGTC